VAFYEGFACPEHQVTMGELLPYYFSFNEGDSACPTCSGLGTYLKVHPDLLVPDKSRSIKGGAFIPEAFKYDKNLWGGRLMYSLSEHAGFDLDTPWRELPAEVVDLILYGTKGERFPLVLPPGRPPARSTSGSCSASTASSTTSSGATSTTAGRTSPTAGWRPICAR
jgi:excinuclease ABC subunit A